MPWKWSFFLLLAACFAGTARGADNFQPIDVEQAFPIDVEVEKVLKRERHLQELQESNADWMTGREAERCLVILNTLHAHMLWKHYGGRYGSLHTEYLVNRIADAVRREDKVLLAAKFGETFHLYTRIMRIPYDTSLNQVRRVFSRSNILDNFEDFKNRPSELSNRVRVAKENLRAPVPSDLDAVFLRTFAVIAIAESVYAWKGYYPRDIQLLAFTLLLRHDPTQTGRLGEIVTGEGKTLIVAMMIVALKKFPGIFSADLEKRFRTAAARASVPDLRGVLPLFPHPRRKKLSIDVITSSPLLAARDAAEVEPFLRGQWELTVCSINSEVDSTAQVSHYDYEEDNLIFEIFKGDRGGQRRCYEEADVVYADMQTLVGDFLRFEFYAVKHGRDVFRRPFSVAIVDEVDSVLVDGLSHKVELNGATPNFEWINQLFVEIWAHLEMLLEKHVGYSWWRGTKVLVWVQGAVRRVVVEEVEGVSREEEVDAGIKEKDADWLIVALEEGAKWMVLGRQDHKLGPDQALGENFMQSQHKKLSELLEKLLLEKILKLVSDATGGPPPPGGTNEATSNEDTEWTIPAHLIDYVRVQAPHYARSAVRARLFSDADQDYVLGRQANGDRKISIVNRETGMVQRNMYWSDGLQQFLECKEQLRTHVERLPGPARTYLDVLTRYENVYGVTGTLGPYFGVLNLGSSPEQDLIQKLNLNLNFLRGVPTFLARKFEEEPPRFAQNAGEQLGHIALRLMREPTRPYLIVTETVKDANQIATQLRECLDALSVSLAQQILLQGAMGKLLGELHAAGLWEGATRISTKEVSPGTSFCSGLGVGDLLQGVENNNWRVGGHGGSPINPRRILLYTRNDIAGTVGDVYDPDHGMELAPGDIVVATALAGRGTDVLLQQNAIDAGGLHVILTYLPASGRVEQQVFGRSARQGQAGSGQMMLVLSASLQVATYYDYENASTRRRQERDDLQRGAMLIARGGWSFSREFLELLRSARNNRSKEALERTVREDVPFLRALADVYERFVALKWKLKRKFYPRPRPPGSRRSEETPASDARSGPGIATSILAPSLSFGIFPLPSLGSLLATAAVESVKLVRKVWRGAPKAQHLFFYEHDMVQINAQLLELWGYFLKYYARDESSGPSARTGEERAEQLRRAFDKFFPHGARERDFVVDRSPPSDHRPSKPLLLMHTPVDVDDFFPATLPLDRGYDFFQNPSYLVQRATTYIHALLSQFRPSSIPADNGQDEDAATIASAISSGSAPSSAAGAPSDGPAPSKELVEEFEDRWGPDLEQAVELDPKHTFPADYMFAVGHCSSTNEKVDIEQVNEKLKWGKQHQEKAAEKFNVALDRLKGVIRQQKRLEHKVEILARMTRARGPMVVPRGDEEQDHNEDHLQESVPEQFPPGGISASSTSSDERTDLTLQMQNRIMAYENFQSVIEYNLQVIAACGERDVVEVCATLPIEEVLRLGGSLDPKRIASEGRVLEDLFGGERPHRAGNDHTAEDRIEYALCEEFRGLGLSHVHLLRKYEVPKPNMWKNALITVFGLAYITLGLVLAFGASGALLGALGTSVAVGGLIDLWKAFRATRRGEEMFLWDHVKQKGVSFGFALLTFGLSGGFSDPATASTVNDFLQNFYGLWGGSVASAHSLAHAMPEAAQQVGSGHLAQVVGDAYQHGGQRIIEQAHHWTPELLHNSQHVGEVVRNVGKTAALQVLTESAQEARQELVRALFVGASGALASILARHHDSQGAQMRDVVSHNDSFRNDIEQSSVQGGIVRGIVLDDRTMVSATGRDGAQGAGAQAQGGGTTLSSLEISSLGAAVQMTLGNEGGSKSYEEFAQKYKRAVQVAWMIPNFGRLTLDGKAACIDLAFLLAGEAGDDPFSRGEDFKLFLEAMKKFRVDDAVAAALRDAFFRAEVQPSITRAFQVCRLLAKGMGFSGSHPLCQPGLASVGEVAKGGFKPKSPGVGKGKQGKKGGILSCCRRKRTFAGFGKDERFGKKRD